MRNRFRAAARAFGSRSIPGFHSFEEFLGLASLLVLLALVALEPGATAGSTVPSAAVRDLGFSMAELPSPAMAAPPTQAQAAMRHE